MVDKRSGKPRRNYDADIVRLQEDLENHIQDSHDELESIKDSQSIYKDEIMKKMQSIEDKIGPVLEDRRDMQGVYKVGKRFQNFVQYWVKWPILIAGVLAIFKFLIENWHRLMEHLTNGH